MSPDAEDEIMTARLHELMRIARADAPDAPEDLVALILRTARWQQALRGTLRAVSDLSLVVGEGLRLIVASGPRAQEPPQ